MSSIAIAVGLNTLKHFPKDGLAGCNNDSLDMYMFFKEQLGVENIIMLQNSKATYKEIIRALERAVAGGYDRIFFSYSAHGTHVLDINGDEADGQDEAFLCYDTSADLNENILVDDELYVILAKAPRTALVEVWLDTCHSGTGLRNLENNGRRDGKPKRIVNRSTAGLAVKPEQTLAAAIRRQLPNVILWSGCRDNESSFDAEIAGRANGAFTHFFLEAYYQNPSSRRCTVHRKMRRLIAKDFKEQHPQLECTFASRFGKVGK